MTDFGLFELNMKFESLDRSSPVIVLEQILDLKIRASFGALLNKIPDNAFAVPVF
jgi:hypothetical protein